MAIAVSASFALSAPLIAIDDHLFARFRPFWLRYQKNKRLPDDDVIDTFGATIAQHSS